MLSKIEVALFEFITNTFQNYRIPLSFKYDENLDVLNEFRKSIQLRINNTSTIEDLVNKYQTLITPSDQTKVLHNLGLFMRTPIRKSEEIGNNLDLQTYNKELSSYRIELRDMFYGEVDYSVKIMFDNHKAVDLFELIYTKQFANKYRTIAVDYVLGEGIESIEDVEYNLMFTNINSIGKVNESNLRFIDFDITLKGLFFLPFYEETFRLQEIVLVTKIVDGNSGPPSMVVDETTIHSKTILQL